MRKYEYLKKNCESVVEYKLTMEEILSILRSTISKQDGDNKDYLIYLNAYVSTEGYTIEQLSEDVGYRTNNMRLFLKRACDCLQWAIITEKNNGNYEDTVYNLNISTKVLCALLRNGYIEISDVVKNYLSGELRKIRYIGKSSFRQIEEELMERKLIPEKQTKYSRRR